MNQISHIFISLHFFPSASTHNLSSFSLQVVGRDGEQRSADERANSREAGGGATAWSRCWSQRLIVSHGSADGCGSEENSAGDLLHLHCDFGVSGVIRRRTREELNENYHRKTPSLWKLLPEEIEMESVEFIGGKSSDFRWKVSFYGPLILNFELYLEKLSDLQEIGEGDSWWEI